MMAATPVTADRGRIVGSWLQPVSSDSLLTWRARPIHVSFRERNSVG